MISTQAVTVDWKIDHALLQQMLIDDNFPMQHCLIQDTRFLKNLQKRVRIYHIFLHVGTLRGMQQHRQFASWWRGVRRQGHMAYGIRHHALEGGT